MGDKWLNTAAREGRLTLRAGDSVQQINKRTLFRLHCLSMLLVSAALRKADAGK